MEAREVGALVASKYRLTERLGEGATGVVFAARHEKTGSEVAVKIVRAESIHAKRALREARAACAVVHPNLVAIRDVLEEDDGATLLVMDRLNGASLKAHLAKNGKLDAAETTGIASGLFAGLEALHRAGVVHRDLKPDNVFLVDGDESVDRRVRILDFGIAKLLPGVQKTETELTASGAMMGTPRYMAPEQAFGEDDVDARADLWAAGAVLYECLTGSLPVPGDNLGQIMKRLASGSIVALSAHPVSVPEPLRSLVDDLLVIDRDARLGSASEARARLSGEAPVPARPVSAPPAPPGAPRTLVIGAGIALASAAVGIAAYALRANPEPPLVSDAAAVVAPSVVASSTSVQSATIAPTPSATPPTSAKPSPRPTVAFSTTTPPPSASASAAAPPTTRILSEPPF